MATHLAVPQHAWQGYDLMADAENIPVVSNLNGASKVVGSNRPTFPSYFSSGAGFDPMMTADRTKPYSSASSASTSDPMVASCASSSSMNTADETDFSLFSAPPSSLLKKNNSLPPPPFSSFSYFSFSFLNEFMQQTQGAAALPFAPVPPAKYTSALNQQPQHYPRAEPLRERRTPSPPPAATANYGPATTVLPLPQASAAFHHQQQQYFHHQQQQLQLQHQAALRQQQQQYHQAQIQAQAQQQVPVYRQESPLLPTPDYHHQQQHFAIHHAQQPQYQPHQPQQYQQQSQAQQAQQPPVQEVYERRESYSDGEYDQSGSDSDGYCGPHESPQVKAAFKNFLRQFKRKEKESGVEGARDYAVEQMSTLPSSLHWRVCLELADFLKRENAASQARKWYAKVVQLQPSASQGWLEYAKLEEECGRLTKCRDILLEGLTHCPYSESLLVKALKHEERIGNLPGARSLMSRLKAESVERTWKTVLEGGLLEARAGNLHVAREVFKYLIRHVPWYGPIFNEAFRLEERHEHHRRASVLVEKGLEENPRYGPLWFSALRVQERLAYEQLSGDLTALRNTVKRALACVPKELVWKIHFEHAQVEERAGNLQRCRREYVRSAYSCPQNLIWKVWLGGARTELSVGNTKAARKLLQRALGAAPRKMRAAVLLECSRLEEYDGHTEAARLILRKARKETKHEWRVFLESVLLEIRANNIAQAIVQAEEALRIHTGTGRLWAVLIHLHWLRRDEPAQLRVFKEALQEVPKSGEVWCEGARIALRRGNPVDARRFLQFAIQFTPQYGDSFVEYLRLELIEKGAAAADVHDLEQMCINADPNYGFIWLQCKHDALDGPKRVLANAREMLLGQEPSQPATGTQRSASASVPFGKRQSSSCGGYAFLNANDQVWPVHMKHQHQRVPLSQREAKVPATATEGVSALHRELTCLTPLSHCVSLSEKWKIIFGGDPIKP